MHNGKDWNVEFILPMRNRLFNTNNLTLPQSFYHEEAAILVPGNFILPFEWFCHEYLHSYFLPSMTYWAMGNCLRANCYFLKNGALGCANLQSCKKRHFSVIPLHECTTFNAEFDYQKIYVLQS